MITRLRETESTNSYVLNSETEEWDIVIADIQRSGRGRNGHRWESPEGGLWMSIALKREIKGLPLITGIAVAESLAEYGIRPCLKWPNDVLVGGKKIAGILVERRDITAVGIGINANFPASILPKGIRENSTSMMDETGKAVDIEALALRIRENLRDAMSGQWIERWKRLSCTIGRKVGIDGPSGAFQGKALDIDEQGALLVETEDGIKRVLAGDCIHL